MMTDRKPLPNPKWLLKLTIALSMGLHGFLLWSPLPTERDRATEPEPELPEDVIKIIDLDRLGAGETPSGTKNDPPPNASATPSVSSPNVTVAPTSTVQSTAPSPQTTATPTRVKPGTGGKDAGGSGATIADPFANFPQYPNAQIGSAGFFLLANADRAAKNTTDAIAQVNTFFQTKVPEAGFDALKTVAKGSFFQVYEVAIANVEPRYLHLIEHDGQTVIALFNEPRSAEQLQREQNIANANPTERTFEQVFAEIYTQLPLEALELDPQVRQKLPSASQNQNLLARGKYNSEVVIAAITQALDEREFIAMPTGKDAYIVQHREDSFLKSLYIVRLEDGAIGIVTAEN
jgi:hypothetical protein